MNVDFLTDLFFEKFSSDIALSQFKKDRQGTFNAETAKSDIKLLESKIQLVESRIKLIDKTINSYIQMHPVRPVK